VYPFADQIEGLVAVGHLGEASVGFKPDPEGRQRNKHGGMTYGKKTLLEWSIVNTPANPRATLVQPSTRGADLETITKWMQDRALPASFRLSKGEVRLGPAPVPAGTAPGEVRIGGGTSAANLALAFPSITRLLRPPTMKSHHLDLPPGVSDGDVRRMVVDGVRRELDRVGRRLRAQGY
jgi:hypothetical protein